MTTAALEQAFATTRSVLENVKPDMLDGTTPCASWDVRTLINHIVGGAHWFATCTEQGTSPDGDGATDDFASGDFVAAFDDGVRRSIAAFNAPGAQEKMITLPFGTLPGAAFMGLATTDTFVHGWDLATATGQPAGELDPALAEQLLAGAKASIADAFRGPDGVAPFGPEVVVGESAPPADRLAAFLGRKV